MNRLAIAVTVVYCLIPAVNVFAEDPCNWKKYDFNVDPNLQCWYNPDGSCHCYFHLGEPVLVPEGGYIAVRFIVRGYDHPSMSHSSLMGPLALGDESYYPPVRLNLHYTGPEPTFSVYTPGGGMSGEYTLQIGQEYCANIIRNGTLVETELYTWPESVLVFSDSRVCEWSMFDRFLVAYDYYTGETGSYCVWDPVGEEVDCKCDRYTSYIEYSIDCVTVCDIGPTATEATTWGGIKSLYR